MIQFRQKDFSSTLLRRVIERLERDHIEDFEINDRISSDSISISCNPNIEIYLPLEYEYSQYGIDSFIRSMVPYMRTSTVLDRNIYVMTLSGKLTDVQLYKLVKNIILDDGYCVFIDEDQRSFSEGKETKKVRHKFNIADKAISTVSGAGLGALAGSTLNKKAAIIGAGVGSGLGYIKQKHVQEKYEDKNKRTTKEPKQPEETKVSKTGKVVGSAIALTGGAIAGSAIGGGLSERRVAEQIKDRMKEIAKTPEGQRVLSEIKHHPKEVAKIFEEKAHGFIKKHKHIGATVGLGTAGAIVGYEALKRKKLKKAYEKDKKK